MNQTIEQSYCGAVSLCCDKCKVKATTTKYSFDGYTSFNCNKCGGILMTHFEKPLPYDYTPHRDEANTGENMTKPTIQQLRDDMSGLKYDASQPIPAAIAALILELSDQIKQLQNALNVQSKRDCIVEPSAETNKQMSEAAAITMYTGDTECTSFYEYRKKWFLKGVDACNQNRILIGGKFTVKNYEYGLSIEFEPDFGEK
jgi:hypothetical protein